MPSPSRPPPQPACWSASSLFYWFGNLCMAAGGRHPLRADPPRDRRPRARARSRTAKWIAYQITYLIGNLLSALNTRPIAYPSRTELDSLSVSLSDRTTCAPPETGEHGEPLSHTHDRARRAHDTREHGGELNLRTAVGAG